ncbi:MAG: hypothetical protein A2V77_17595 [Anaeromyxobacter sp. RBG_16_69_14]|nr:MAG: hypothetical protein A2V77_17595 [Anaeromyxobacter sp. RBG_16_69_14]
MARLRVRAHHIGATTFREAHEVVEWLGAVQAQDYLGALWAVGLRLRQAGEADVERALAGRTILRTWPMRGTLHFVAARDVRWMLDLMAPRSVARAASRLRELEIDDGVLASSRKVLVKALQGGRQLSRPAMYRVLQEARISTAGQRGIHILWRLAHEGLLCFGPRQGKQQTFVLLEEWVPAARRLTREEALAEVAHRYFTGHGPATLGDFVWWTGLSPADARLALDLAGSRLRSEDIDGQTFWLAPRPPLRSPVAPGSLLPGFDELVVGYKDRTALVDPLHRPRLNPGDNGMLSPTILVGDRILGTWRRTLQRGGVAIEPRPFAPLAAAGQRALSGASERYARFLGLPIVER